MSYTININLTKYLDQRERPFNFYLLPNLTEKKDNGPEIDKNK
jgi:hypothetical protein